MASKEQQIQQILESTVEARVIELWGLDYLSQGTHRLLRLNIEGDKRISVDESALVSHQLRAILHVKDPITGD